MGRLGTRLEVCRKASAMSSAIGDQSDLRKRKAAAVAEAAGAERNQVAQADRGEELSEVEREYVEYFRSKYGENPRSDFLGIDGFGLFCLIYIVIAGVILSILYFSVYARNRNIWNSPSSSAGK